MNIIWSYFVDHYIKVTIPFMPVCEVVFLLCAILVFFSMQSGKKAVLSVILQFIPLWLLLIIFKALVLSDWGKDDKALFNATYTYLFYISIYALIAGYKTIRSTLLKLTTFWTSYVFATTFAKACGGVLYNYILIKDYTITANFTMVGIIVPAIIIITTVILKCFSHKNEKEIKNKYIALSIAIFLFANLAKILVDSIKEADLPFFGVNEQGYSLFIFLSGLLLYLLNFVCYFFSYDNMIKSNENEAISKAIHELKNEKLLLKDSAEMFNNSLEEMRLIRHDIKNQISYLRIMTEMKEYPKVESYLKELCQNFSPFLTMVDCENLTIRNVLNLENSKARRHNISIDSKIILPESLNISDFDLTSLLLNLLDNAIEACVDDNCSNCTIDFNMQVRDAYLYINVVNPVLDVKKNAWRSRLQTYKVEKELHGRGTKIIQSIVDKYNGVFLHQIENDSFIVDIMLELPAE